MIPKIRLGKNMGIHTGQSIYFIDKEGFVRYEHRVTDI